MWGWGWGESCGDHRQGDEEGQGVDAKGGGDCFDDDSGSARAYCVLVLCANRYLVRMHAHLYIWYG